MFNPEMEGHMAQIISCTEACVMVWLLVLEGGKLLVCFLSASAGVAGSSRQAPIIVFGFPFCLWVTNLQYLVCCPFLTFSAETHLSEAVPLKWLGSELNPVRIPALASDCWFSAFTLCSTCHCCTSSSGMKDFMVTYIILPMQWDGFRMVPYGKLFSLIWLGHLK